MNRFYLFILFCITSLTLSAQEQLLRGQLIDGVTSKPIAFANIFFNGGKGTVSDRTGEFEFALEQPHSDTLWVSCMGYAKKYFLLSNWNFQDKAIIKLTSNVQLLDSIAIQAKSLDAYKILEQAFQSIPQNCANRKAFYKVGYRERLTDSVSSRASFNARTVSSIMIIEDKGLKKGKLYKNGLLRGIKENVYLVGLDKYEKDSVIDFKMGPIQRADCLRKTLKSNAMRYTQPFMLEPNPKYSYRVRNYYYDSLLGKNIITIGMSFSQIEEKPDSRIRKMDMKLEVEIILTDIDYKILQTGVWFNSYATTKDNDMYDFSYWNFAQYRENAVGKIEPVYLWYKEGMGNLSWFTENEAELKILGVVKNPTETIRKLPKMNTSQNIYNQKVMEQKPFWINQEVILLYTPENAQINTHELEELLK